ncbi:LexA family transcriptional regulator [Pseudomonas costantinii]|uniref:XRE family transcriptional regulator n=1 Tax=Pseudomonas costantinii TaxID=168469 RepID=UPI0015A4C97E|nr:XRE family transcriptional regulator [Pseudomonas costantinii]NVZ22162.1 LexA family transcriptional regulator [Pseudomonas costantinii]
MTELAERIKRARKNAGKSQAQLAEACGWSQSRVGNYEAGTREPSFADIELMAKALRVEKSELLLDTQNELTAPGQADDQATRPSTAEIVNLMLAKHGKNLTDDARRMISDAVNETARELGSNNVITVDFSRPGQVGDEVWIAHYDVRGAMGDGQVPHDYPETFQDVRVSPSHLRELGVQFKEHFHLKMISGQGESMAPTIKSRDPLLIDVTIREFTGDGIYALTWQNHFYIKRLQVLDEDNFEMLSDNPLHGPRTIRKDDTYIQGRILFVWNGQPV